MPWEPRVSEAQVRAALEGGRSWREVLDALGYQYHGKTINTVRKWASRWGIPTDHLSNHGSGRRNRARYTERELADAVAASYSYAEALRRLGLCPTGGNWKTLKKRVEALGISVEHFDPYATNRRLGRKSRIPLDQILVRNSTYSRDHLKRRLYEEGLKERRCELCGQGEIWRDKPISLILDHANGIRDDNRIENLRIVCPNCAASLETHCGRKNRIEPEPRSCLRCGAEFRPRYSTHRYCSRACGSRHPRTPEPRLKARRVERPPHDQLLREIDELGYLAVGRKYGVSDNAVRKWVRQYERERAIAEDRDADVVEIPRRTWPNRRRDEEAA